MRCFRRIKCGRSCELRHAFTLIELLVIFFSLIAILFVIPSLVRQHRRVVVKACANNLKEISLAFRYWEMEGDRFCTSVSTNSGGTLELINSGQVFPHFRAMWGEFASSKMLACRSDKQKVRAINFGSGFSYKNVSYFVSVDVKDSYNNPEALLSGDRNLIFKNQAIKTGFLMLTTNRLSLGWSTALHHLCGNVLLIDGSVSFLGSSELAKKACEQGLATNRLAVP